MLVCPEPPERVELTSSLTLGLSAESVLEGAREERVELELSSLLEECRGVAKALDGLEVILVIIAVPVIERVSTAVELFARDVVLAAIVVSSVPYADVPYAVVG